MARLLMQQALSPEWLDGLFEEKRQRQSTRERLFSTEVDLMALVALGLRPSLHAAAQDSSSGSMAAPRTRPRWDHRRRWDASRRASSSSRPPRRGMSRGTACDCGGLNCSWRR